ncbi:conserved hypothetical protein [Burkholderia cenocepacia HI2424]|uniref:DUF3304 domain-containing protein n=2 Tax=Burkholderia cepacia complex TaxID=87882 RepID=A0A427NJB6_9BURK|nr:conserved hypothetical protein [Burkholderia cenocepacia HI2424]AQT51867.1 hypothetical protein BHQ31_17240 [Burkholderia cenocepacia]PNO74028.1 DUF3304 domain-containing protein [Burkholderia cenocepacia]QIY39985.1 DUF3304 domain-containing protein [Burkholderia cenocepacia]RSC02876.1 DUF3304 domain-containing protein [Burkholderia cenocepacia]
MPSPRCWQAQPGGSTHRRAPTARIASWGSRGVYSFVVDGFGAGSVHARQFGGGGGTVCCMSVPRGKQTWHVRVTYDLTAEEDARNQAPEIVETEVAVPALPNRRDGYIEFRFLPGRKIDARWAAYPTMPRMRDGG